MKEKIVINREGQEVERLAIPEIFQDLPNSALIYEAIKNEHANARVGTASQKTRREVNGSNRKPWAQKGLGRARAGDRKSPIWRGGGVIFAAKPRPWAYNLPKKVKRGAFISLFTARLSEEDFFLIDQFQNFSGKTREIVQNLNFFFQDRRSLLVIGDDTDSDKLMRRGLRNVPFVRFQSYRNLSAHAIFYSKKILMTKDVFLSFVQHLERGQ